MNLTENKINQYWSDFQDNPTYKTFEKIIQEVYEDGFWRGWCEENNSQTLADMGR